MTDAERDRHDLIIARAILARSEGEFPGISAARNHIDIKQALRSDGYLFGPFDDGEISLDGSFTAKQLLALGARMLVLADRSAPQLNYELTRESDPTGW